MLWLFMNPPHCFSRPIKPVSNSQPTNQPTAVELFNSDASLPGSGSVGPVSMSNVQCPLPVVIVHCHFPKDIVKSNFQQSKCPFWRKLTFSLEFSRIMSVDANPPPKHTHTHTSTALMVAEWEHSVCSSKHRPFVPSKRWNDETKKQKGMPFFFLKSALKS